MLADRQMLPGIGGKALAGLAVRVPWADLRFHHIGLAVDLPDISFTVSPIAASLRTQQCALPQASMPTRQDGRPVKNGAIRIRAVHGVQSEIHNS
ncbi:hypothetical protein SAMN05192564_10464 [Paraburkholderia sartisoli]|uniref:Uncharacterized protein n=1 Tax=Paraburkholderia sartisoli TaxID=83784 RepID=A0A1H4F2S6_9BURK|nr:hypothetical protein SAMN05192564_10464 [Paraburkholderia sartisoli]